MRPAIIHYGNKNESRRSERSFVRVIVVAVFISVQLTGNSDDKKAKKGEKKRKKERYHNAFSLSLSLILLVHITAFYVIQKQWFDRMLHYKRRHATIVVRIVVEKFSESEISCLREDRVLLMWVGIEKGKWDGKRKWKIEGRMNIVKGLLSCNYYRLAWRLEEVLLYLRD